MGFRIFAALFVAGVLAIFLPGAQGAEAIDCTSSDSARADCQQQYDDLQKEIAAQQAIIDTIRTQEKTYQGSVTLLDQKIKQAQAQIKQKNIEIAKLSSQIDQKNQHISELQSKINSGKDSLAALVRRQNQVDDLSLPEIAFGADEVNDLFTDVDQVVAIEQGLRATFAAIRGDQSVAEQEKAALAAAQDKTADAKFDIQTTQTKAASAKAEQQQLLSVAKSSEAAQQKVLAQNQAKAAAIRAALFPLRDAAAIQFGDALTYAQAAQKATGVDPALVLAILTQESNLGANVGQCYLTDDATGAGIGKNTGTPFKAVMNPTRDVPPFLALSRQLGFDAHQQVVSCPIASVGGWGGAMGPAQFIPSTWALYAARVGAARGEGVANPWSAPDAIMAMSYLLADNGASAGGYTADFNAAARYYAGWSGPSTSAGRSYATQVMAKVAGIQQNIDFLKNN